MSIKPALLARIRKNTRLSDPQLRTDAVALEKFIVDALIKDLSRHHIDQQIHGTDGSHAPDCGRLPKCSS